jgi:hypothetical protein
VIRYFATYVMAVSAAFGLMAMYDKGFERYLKERKEITVEDCIDFWAKVLFAGVVLFIISVAIENWAAK